MRSSRPARRYGVAVLLTAALGMFPCAGTAADAFGPDTRADIAELKAQALERVAAKRAEALQRQYPERTRLSVYVGVGVERFVLEQVTVRIDDRPLVTYDYREDEAAALLDGTLHRILRTNIEPGGHRVRLDFSGRLWVQDQEDPPLTGHIELAFDKRDAAKALILPVAPEALRPTRQIRPSSWEWRQEAVDPRLGMVRFQRHIGATYPAITELLSMAPAAGRQGLPGEYHGLLAHAYLDFAMEAQARAALDEAQLAGVEARTARDVRLRLAELVFEQGRDAEAAAELKALHGDLTTEQLVIWQGLMARLLMGQGRHDEAVRALNEGDTALEVLTEPGAEDKQTLYMRYNYAVALLQSGDTVRGRTLLDRLGRMRPFTPAQRALRDRANLALAYDFLADDQGATAKDIFQRIRLDGPYTERALLGLGWAELAPRGRRHQRAAVGDEPEAGTYGISDTQTGRFNRRDMPERFSADAFRQVELTPFKQAKQAAGEDARRRRALVAWNELAARPPVAAAAQEARVAVAYALEELGAEGPAMRRYRDGVAELEQLRERLQQRIRALREPRDSAPAMAESRPLSLRTLTGMWQAHYLPDVGEARWLEEFLASQRVHELAGHYLDLHLLALALRGHLPALDPELRLDAGGYKGVALAGGGDAFGGGSGQAALLSAMDAAGGDLRQRLRARAADTLSERLALLDEFLAAARMGLARMYEKRLAQAGSPGPGNTVTAVPVSDE